MSKLLHTILAIVGIASTAISGDLIATRSKDVTSRDVPLQFELEKTTWDGDAIDIWGTVRNNSTNTYVFVKVIFTVRDAQGEFIGRMTWYTDPADLGTNHVGYIEHKHVLCEGRHPALLEFSVLADKKP